MPHTEQTLNQMADEIFELYRLIAIARSRRPAAQDDLSETEFLTLDVLAREQPLTIGDIQRRIGVQPAQMSRVVRALEERSGRGYVECEINPEDRRRVDVRLTDRGGEAHDAYRAVRVGSMRGVLSVLCPDDRMHFMRILRQIRHAVASELERNEIKAAT